MNHAYIMIRLNFNKQVTENEMGDIISELDYSIIHPNIESTEIVDMSEEI